MAAAERLEQDRAGPLAVLGVEAVARDRHQALDEAVQRVAPDEQPHALALAEPQDPHRDVEHLVGAHLEQRVARVGLDDLEQRLAVVAGRRVPGLVQHLLDLLRQQRDVARTGLVGGGRVQAQEAALTRDLAVGPELLDADVVEIRRPVNVRSRVGLGQHEHVRCARELERLRPQALERGRRGVAKDPQAGVRDGLQAGLFALLHEVVLAVAEEREVVRGDPLEEVRDLLQLGRIDGRGLALELLVQLLGLGAHRLPVLHRQAHLAEHTVEVLVQPLELGRVALAHDLGVDDRLRDRTVVLCAGLEHLGQPSLVVAQDAYHRVDHEVDAVALAPQLHRHRVDDERHVVGDDLDHRVRRLPAVLLEVRVVDVDLRLTRRAPLGQVPLRDRGAVQVDLAAIGQIHGGDPVVELPDEGLTRGDAIGGQLAADPFADPVD